MGLVYFPKKRRLKAVPVTADGSRGTAQVEWMFFFINSAASAQLISIRLPLFSSAYT